MSEQPEALRRQDYRDAELPAISAFTAEQQPAAVETARRRRSLRALLQAADVLFAHHCRDCTAQNWLDDTRAALAEGAQG